MSSFEMFNQHQEDSRKRTEFLAKSVFLLSGSALSFSISIFLGDKAPKIPADLLSTLKIGWWALFFSMACYVLVICTMLMRDYSFGERWRKSMRGIVVENLDGEPGMAEAMMWILGTMGILSTMTGFCCLAIVSTALIGK